MDSPLVLDIDANAETTTHIGTGYRKEDSNKRVVTVNLRLSDEIAEVGTVFTNESGTTKYVATEKSVKTKTYKPAVAQGGIEEGISASVAFYSKANSSAHADFDFEGHEFDEGSVWYYAPE